jgi:hypothetical protein
MVEGTIAHQQEVRLQRIIVEIRRIFSGMRSGSRRPGKAPTIRHSRFRPYVLHNCLWNIDAGGLDQALEFRASIDFDHL